MTETDQKQKMLQKLMAQEKERVAVEKYSYSRLGSWWYVIPALMLVGLIIYYLLIYFVSKDLANGIAFFVLFAGMAPIIPIASYNEKWDTHLEAKQKLWHGDYTYKFSSGYKHGYNYTDSLLEKQIYSIAKIASYLLGIVGFGILALLAFSWLGSITIAPTTIIIILLIIIISKQEKH